MERIYITGADKLGLEVIIIKWIPKWRWFKPPQWDFFKWAYNSDVSFYTYCIPMSIDILHENSNEDPEFVISFRGTEWRNSILNKIKTKSDIYKIINAEE